MRKFISRFMLVSTLALTACAPMHASRGQWVGPLERNVAQDDLECRALANQAAMGSGGWTSVAPVQAAIRDEAAQQYFIQCVQARGYTWVTTR